MRGIKCFIAEAKVPSARLVEPYSKRNSNFPVKSEHLNFLLLAAFHVQHYPKYRALKNSVYDVIHRDSDTLGSFLGSRRHICTGHSI